MNEAHLRYGNVWETYYAVVTAGVAVAALASDYSLWRRLLAVGALAAGVVLHLTIGREAVNRRDEDARGLMVLAGYIACFAGAVASAQVATWALFAVIPIVFQLAPMRVAIPAVVLVNLINPVVGLLEDSRTVAMDLVIGVISSAGGIWMGFWNVRVIEQNVERGRLIEELEASRAEIARLSHEAGVSAERARLAAEIHDTLAQGFTSIVTLLQAADPTLSDERLALAVRTAKENLAEARALVRDLQPVALASGSLPEAVRRQAARFTEESGVPATVRVTGDPRPLETAAEVVLLRAAQEALTNVRRHAHASSVQVLLAYGDLEVRLTVRDDGTGFTPGASDGFGLSGMKARAGQVDGRLTVSGAGGGTTIELEVPA